MRTVSIACPLTCLVAAWITGCATERLDAVAPSGVNLTGEWKFNPNLSDDPDKVADPEKTPQRSPGGHRGHGGRGGGGGMPPMGSPPTAAMPGHGWPGGIEIQGGLLGSESAATTGFLPVALTASGIEQAAPLPPSAAPTTGGSPPSRGGSINRLLKAPMHVSITQKEGTLIIKTDLPDGTHTVDEYTAGTSNTIPYGPDSTADRSVGWRGPVFVITTAAKKAGWREDDFALDDDGRLILTTQTKGGRLGTVDITRVYDRVRGAESQ
ncbi:MAG: hypothetical protein JWO52_5037 [Gammaproteobacteria bacterium]|nr:hypothetical protein [Gammaproteobacteria bacterium]